MPQFRYDALDSSGTPQTGEIAASDQGAALEALLARGLTPLKIETAAAQRTRTRDFSMPARQTTLFLEELAGLLKGGVAMSQALKLLGGESKNPKQKYLGETLSEGVTKGWTLADAMRGFPQVFDSTLIGLVEVGERSGALPGVLRQAVSGRKEAEQMRDEILSAMIYPAILLSVGLISILVLVGLVVPRFGQIFKTLRQEIPTATRFMLGLGEIVQAYWILGAIVLLAGVLFVRMAWQRQGGRRKLEGWLLRMPLLGGLTIRAFLVTFCRSLGIMLGGGVTLIQALDALGDTVSQDRFREDLKTIREKTHRGLSLSQAVSEVPYLPGMASHLLRMGEERGDLAETLIAAAEYFESDLRRLLKRVVSLVEPIMILGMGLAIGAALLTMLSVLLEVSDIAF